MSLDNWNGFSGLTAKVNPGGKAFVDISLQILYQIWTYKSLEHELICKKKKSVYSFQKQLVFPTSLNTVKGTFLCLKELCADYLIVAVLTTHCMDRCSRFFKKKKKNRFQDGKVN